MVSIRNNIFVWIISFNWLIWFRHRLECSTFVVDCFNSLHDFDFISDASIDRCLQFYLLVRILDDRLLEPLVERVLFRMDHCPLCDHIATNRNLVRYVRSKSNRAEKRRAETEFLRILGIFFLSVDRFDWTAIWFYSLSKVCSTMWTSVKSLLELVSFNWFDQIILFNFFFVIFGFIY